LHKNQNKGQRFKNRKELLKHTMAEEKIKEEESFEEGNEEEFSTEDLVYDAHLKIDALIDLLIEKQIITEEEFNAKLDKIVEEDFEEEE